MAYTFVDLQDRVIDAGGYGEVDRAKLKTFINIAYRDCASRRRWSWTEKQLTITTAANTGTNTVPVDQSQFGRLRPATSGIAEPDYLDWQTYSVDFHSTAPADLSVGVPEVYSLYDDKIWWNPIPNAAYSYSLQYWQSPADLVADDDAPMMPESDRDVLVFGALWLAMLRDKDYALSQNHQNTYEGMIAKMARKDRLRQSETPRKIPLPRSYGGMYD